MPSGPDARGYFGPFGGRYVPETLMPVLEELTRAYTKFRHHPAFRREYRRLLADYAGRPSPLTFAGNLTRRWGPRLYLKREDLNHTGSHKINNCLGQILLARAMGKRRVIAETGAGQHGVATATVCALFGLRCEVYMGVDDVKRQALNVFRMRLLGARVHEVSSGTRTLKDAMNEAMRDWVTNVRDTYYLIGTVAGPHPYPVMVRDFQRVIGDETRRQVMKAEGRLPDALVACVGGGSNAMGLFYPFRNDRKVRFWGVEAGGLGLRTGRHSATLGVGRPGVLHGARSYLLQTQEGQVLKTHSISAGLDYPGVGPEHSLFKDQGRAHYVSVTDREALKAVRVLCLEEGILPALESAHAVAFAEKLSRRLSRRSVMVVNISGRGDKDVPTLIDRMRP